MSKTPVQGSTNPSIWWIRRDLRLGDNQALAAALQAGGPVIPAFILDPALLQSGYSGEKRSAFLFSGLHLLDADLRARGSRLIVRRGDPIAVLAALARECGAVQIYAEPDVSPYARQRDRRAAQALYIRWHGSPAALPPGQVVKNSGDPYIVFTPFSRAWREACPPPGPAPLPAPDQIHTPESILSEPIPGTPDWPAEIPFPCGEAEAARRLLAFTTGGLEPGDLPGPHAPIYGYLEGRDRLDLDGTSRLSPYLRFGMVSARQAVAAAYQAIAAAPDGAARRSAETWLNELIWREFYLHILYHFPRARQGNFRLGDIQWQNDPGALAAWCAGQTGIPVVDAAQRQLVRSGWMHNRARMISASFLTKDLLVDWRLGERFFMQHLVDGDPASNNGGWQWTAGTGTDAAPYFRIFNPVSQGQRFDPMGAYVRRWVPELSRVPAAYIHEPWKMPVDVQQSAGCVLGKDYPMPIIDHVFARQRALEVYGHAG